MLRNVSSIAVMAFASVAMSLVFCKPASANWISFMRACMNEGGSYGFCQCAGGHINAGADVYQAARLCNRGLSAPGSTGRYNGNNVACMMMRDEPLMLAAMGCY
jgi:hypothetical protein